MNNLAVNMFEDLRKKYILELQWAGMEYINDEEIKLSGVCFSGPVLSDAAQIKPNDNITLDFSSMYHLFIPHFYLANLSWVGVDYRNNKVLLKDVVLKGEFAIKVPKWNRGDYIVIDTSKHEERLHAFNLTYNAFVVNKEGEVYKF